MAIVPNRSYNDPALGQAFSNLAAAFAPPSGSDMAGYAAAAAKKAEAERLAQLYAAAGSPDFNQPTFDRQAIAAGLYNPTQSFYAQDQNNSTTIRGQDVTANTTITTNNADNDRAMMEAILGAATKPLGQGEVRPAFNPADYGVGSVPAVPQFAGTPKPLSETELKAAILGGMDPALQQAAAFGSTPLQEVLGADGKPVLATGPAAIGAQPFVKPTGETTPRNYKTPDGKVGTAVLLNGTLVDTQTQQPIPANSQIFSSSLQGGAAETGLGPTTANQTSAVNRAAEVTRTLGLLDLYEGVIKQDPGAVGMAGAIKGLAQNTLAVSQDLAMAFGASVPELQQFQQQLQGGLQNVAPEMFNPNIPEVEFYQGALAYALARTENPSGEVSRQAYERAYDRVTGGTLRNSQTASAAVAAFRQMLNTELDGIKALQNPETARTDTSYQGGATPPGGEVYATNPQTGERLQLVNGQWVPVQ